MSKAIIDKVDSAMIVRAAAPEDLKLVAALSQQSFTVPTHSIDVFKNRRGKFNRVRLWVQLDLSNGYMTELFLTDEYGSPLDVNTIEGKDLSAVVEDIPKMLVKAEKPEEKIEQSGTPIVKFKITL